MTKLKLKPIKLSEYVDCSKPGCEFPTAYLIISEDKYVTGCCVTHFFELKSMLEDTHD